MAKEKDISNELIQEIMDKFSKLGYVVEDISEENPTMAHCRFYIYKEDNPEIYSYAWDGKELELTYNNLVGKLAEEEKKQEIKKLHEKTGLPTDELGTILCKQLGLRAAHPMNVIELAQCIECITNEKFVYATHTDKAHRHMLFYSEKLAEMGLTTFKVNSGSYIISVMPTDDKGWYSAYRLNSRQEKYYNSMLGAERKHLNFLKNK